MESSQTADLIWQHWQAGTVLDALPEGTAPSTRAEGYAAQAGLESKSAQPRAGWKIAATSAAGQNHIGVGGPLVGRLLAEKLFEDGAEVSMTRILLPLIETSAPSSNSFSASKRPTSGPPTPIWF